MKTSLFRDSYNELKKLRTLTALAMFMAMSLILARFSIRFPEFSLTWSPIIKMYVGMLFGPVTGAVYGCALDLLGFFINNRGDAFFPGYTFTETLGVFLYGLALYKKKLSLPRVFAIKLIVIIICNLILGTLWLAIMTGKGFWFYLPARIPSNIFNLIAHSLVFYLIAQCLNKAGVTRLFRSSDTERSLIGIKKSDKNDTSDGGNI